MQISSTLESFYKTFDFASDVYVMHETVHLGFYYTFHYGSVSYRFSGPQQSLFPPAHNRLFSYCFTRDYDNLDLIVLLTKITYVQMVITLPASFAFSITSPVLYNYSRCVIRLHVFQ